MKQTAIVPQQTNPIAITSAPVAQLVTAWRADLDVRVHAGELSGSTATTYAAGVEKFVSWADGQNLAGGVTADIIRGWMGHERDSGARPGSVNTWLAGVRSLMGWAVERGQLQTNPTANLKGVSRRGTSKRHKRESLTNDEVRRLLAIPDASTNDGARDAAIVALMVYTGARTIELHRADVDDVRTMDGNLCLAVRGKGRAEADEVVVIAHPDAVNAVHNWLAIRRQLAGKDGPLFCSLSNRTRGQRLSLSFIRRAVMDYMKSAGIVGAGSTKSTHSLRHTAITNAIRHGAPITQVQAMARHANLATTSVYVHEVSRMDNPAESFIRYDDNGVR